MVRIEPRSITLSGRGGQLSESMAEGNGQLPGMSGERKIDGKIMRKRGGGEL